MLEIQFMNSKGMTDSQLQDLELKMNFILPNEIKDFLRANAGSRPFINGKVPCFNITHSNGRLQGEWIENVPSYEQLLIYNENKDYLNLFFTHFGLGRDYVEVEYLFPFLYLPAGSVFIATKGQHKGKIYTADNGDFGILLNAPSLSEFWNSIHIGDY